MELCPGSNLEDLHQVLYLRTPPRKPELGENLEDLHQLLQHGKTLLKSVLGGNVDDRVLFQKTLLNSVLGQSFEDYHQVRHLVNLGKTPLNPVLG